MPAEPYPRARALTQGMGNRGFAAVVAAGLLALAALAASQATASRRLVQRAESGGLAHARLQVREMG